MPLESVITIYPIDSAIYEDLAGLIHVVETKLGTKISNDSQLTTESSGDCSTINMTSSTLAGSPVFTKCYQSIVVEKLS